MRPQAAGHEDLRACRLEDVQWATDDVIDPQQHRVRATADTLALINRLGLLLQCAAALQLPTPGSDLLWNSHSLQPCTEDIGDFRPAAATAGKLVAAASG